MHPDIVQALTDWQNDACEWQSNPIIDHDGICVPICQAVGKDSMTPIGAPGQPRWYPKNSKYQFDSDRFKGLDAKNDLIDMLKSSCPGCTLYLQVDDNRKGLYQLRCNHYPIQHESTKKFSDPQRFTKDNVVRIGNKRSQSYKQSGFRRMNNPKMRSRPRVRSVVDRRDPKKKPKQKNKRGESARAASKSTRCEMNIRFFMDQSTKTWHLNTKSNFQHTFHISKEEDVSTLNRDDLTDDNLNALNILFQSGVNPSVIAKVMTKLVHMSSEKKGEFLTSTIHNIGTQEQTVINEMRGISPDWTSAQRLLATLAA